MSVDPLFEGRLEPMSWAMGFIEAPLDVVAHTLSEWRRSLHPAVTERPLTGPLESLLTSLLPLTLPTSRELLVPNGGWTAYFDNGLRGTDEISPVSQLALRCQTTAVGIHWKREPVDVASIGFSLFGPLHTEFLNHVRSIQLSRDHQRWHWTLTGTAQAFEEPAAYGARRPVERFTPEMLSRYTRSLSFDPFDADAYQTDARLVEVHRESEPKRSRSLAAARQAIGLGQGTTS